jgi:hypothetical protein
MHRRVIAAFTVLLLALLPTAASAETAAQAERNQGTASTSLELLSLEVEGTLAALLGSLRSLSVATGSAFASIDAATARNPRGRPYAESGITLPVVGTVSASSDGPSQQSGRQSALPGGLGSVTSGVLQATADAASAQALLDLLSGQLSLPVGGATAALSGEGVAATVDGASALARNGVVLRDVSLRLGDLLPADLLAALPLEVLLQLIRDLPIAGGELSGAVSQLRQLLAELGAVGPIEQALAGAVAQLVALLAPLDDVLRGIGAPLTVEELAALATSVEGLLATVDGLVGQLETVLGTITGLLTALDGLDLAALLRDLLDRLAGLELLGIERLAVGVVTTAAGATSQALSSCELSGVRVVGQAVPAVATCDQLRSALESVRATVLGVLNALPISGVLPGDIVRVDGLRSVTTPAGAVADGYYVAGASWTGLDIQVQSVSLAGLADSLVAAVLGLLGNLDGLLSGDLGGLLGGGGSAGLVDADLSALIGNLLGGGLPGLGGGLLRLNNGLQAVAADADEGSDVTESVRGLVRGIGQGSTYSVVDTSAISGLVASVTGALGGLPLGDLLAGLSTPGLRLRALDISAETSYLAAGPTAVPIAQVPTSEPLPRTGGGMGLAALILLTAGAGLGGVALRRNRATP